ncbi:MAG: IS110 family transposase, partial [Bacteroidales bacterium]|nr:IS110 family transposase [Bacteroidales bacterium]
IKKEIKNLIDNDAELLRRQKLLVSIKGIGFITAAKLLGEIRDIRVFFNNENGTTLIMKTIPPRAIVPK